MLHSVCTWGMMTRVIQMLNILWTDTEQSLLPTDPPISEYRKKKLALIKPEQARRCSLCAELLLNKAVRIDNEVFPLPLEIGTKSNGKPFLIGHEYEFSISHSAHYAACALSDLPVGLDIQNLSKCDERLVKRCFTEIEQNYILSSKDRDAAFTRLWCRKESFLKAIGTGLRLPLVSFDVSEIRTGLDHQGVAYGFRECCVDELFFCICMPIDGLLPEIKPQYCKLP